MRGGGTGAGDGLVAGTATGGASPVSPTPASSTGNSLNLKFGGTFATAGPCGCGLPIGVATGCGDASGTGDGAGANGPGNRASTSADWAGSDPAETGGVGETTGAGPAGRRTAGGTIAGPEIGAGAGAAGAIGAGRGGALGPATQAGGCARCGASEAALGSRGGSGFSVWVFLPPDIHGGRTFSPPPTSSVGAFDTGPMPGENACAATPAIGRGGATGCGTTPDPDGRGGTLGTGGTPKTAGAPGILGA